MQYPVLLTQEYKEDEDFDTQRRLIRHKSEDTWGKESQALMLYRSEHDISS